MSQWFTRMRHEAIEQVKLFGREMDDCARLPHQTALAVQFDLTNSNPGFTLALSLPGSPNRGPDSRGQFADVKRLGDIVIRTSIQGIDFVIRTISNSQHQNGKTRS